MNESTIFILNNITTQKEPILFFLLQAYFIALVCYDFELDCCTKKALHDCKVCYKKKVLPFVAKKLKLPSNECFLYEEELVGEVVEIEKHTLALKDDFVQKESEVALMKTNLLQCKIQEEGLYEEIKGAEYELKMSQKVFEDSKYSHFVEIQRLKEENRYLKSVLCQVEQLAEELAEAQNDTLV
ncbi:hypothetical protein BD770DRAFT_426511 [Pilaira anomala]|nr:hypothetical protein BD770DRAFT_426511 [Pilaira anomala]